MYKVVLIDLADKEERKMPIGVRTTYEQAADLATSYCGEGHIVKVLDSDGVAVLQIG